MSSLWEGIRWLYLGISLLISKFYILPKNTYCLCIRKSHAIFKHGPQSLTFYLYKGKPVKSILMDKKGLVKWIKGYEWGTNGIRVNGTTCAKCGSPTAYSMLWLFSWAGVCGWGRGCLLEMRPHRWEYAGCYEFFWRVGHQRPMSPKTLDW